MLNCKCNCELFYYYLNIGYCCYYLCFVYMVTWYLCYQSYFEGIFLIDCYSILIKIFDSISHRVTRCCQTRHTGGAECGAACPRAIVPPRAHPLLQRCCATAARCVASHVHRELGAGQQRARRAVHARGRTQSNSAHAGGTGRQG